MFFISEIMDSRESTVYAAPALEKGLDILELLAGASGGLTQKEIAARLDRSTGEIFRMLEVLQRRGFLARDGRDGSYRLTLRLFEMAHRHPPTKRLLTVALPVLNDLARTIGQSAHMSVHHDGRLLVVAQSESSEPMSFSVRLGAHFPFQGDRVSTWVLTAFAAEEDRMELTVRMLDGARDRRAVERRLADIRRRGYSETPSDTIKGIVDLCFPIFDHSGAAVAAVTVPYLMQRDVRARLGEARAALGNAAQTISEGLGAPRRAVEKSPPARRRPIASA
jgi:DNA-binding IclR family transcriptional regulator